MPTSLATIIIELSKHVILIVLKIYIYVINLLCYSPKHYHFKLISVPEICERVGVGIYKFS